MAAQTISRSLRGNIHVSCGLFNQGVLVRQRGLTKADGHKKLAPVISFDTVIVLVVLEVSMRFILSLLTVVLFTAILAGCNSNEVTPVKSSIPKASSSVPADGARRVTVAELQDLLAKDQAVVIDVRNQQSFDAGHIRGAILIPEADLPNHLSELPKGKTIVTYCS
jgi:hypothetical protein